MNNPAAIPIIQPNNQAGSVEVLPLVKYDLAVKGLPTWRSEKLQFEVLEDLQARSEYGFNKYGVRLHVPNGRPFMLDAYQEILDAIVYCRGAIVEQCPYYSDHPLQPPIHEYAPLEVVAVYFDLIQAAYAIKRFLR